MELQAVIEVIAAASEHEPLWIRSDSQYVVRGYGEWIYNWAQKNWQDVKNPDLWQHLWDIRENRLQRVHLEWVRGHAGNQLNEYADALAEAGRLSAIEVIHESLDVAQMNRLFDIAIMNHSPG
jgi:ribonuclease HI